MRPALRNFVDNPIMVQFVHRWLAFVVAAVALWLGGAGLAAGLPAGGGAARRRGRSPRSCSASSPCCRGVQIDIAVAHQGMAVLLLGAMVSAAHRLGERRP